MVNDLIAHLAARQHGLVRTDQLNAIGLSNGAITKRAGRGLLHREYRGVFSNGHRALSLEARLLAAVFAAGEGAALSHYAAATLWGLWRHLFSVIDVIVSGQRRAESPIRIHRSRGLHPHDVTELDGIPITTVARLLVDMSDHMTKWELANMIHEAAFLGRYSPLATEDAISRANGRHHLPKLEQAIEMHRSGSAGVRSRAELRFLSALERAGLPEPLVNTQLGGFEADCHWPSLSLAVEVDGPGHARARTVEEDRVKELAWRDAGYCVMRFSVDEIGAAVQAVSTASRPSARASSRGRPAR